MIEVSSRLELCKRKLLSHFENGSTRVSGWQFTAPAVALRAALIGGLLLPVMAIFSRRKTFGQRHLNSLDGPVIFAANHLSVADNPAVLLALPWRWRLRVATAASREVMRDRGRMQSFFAALISNGFHFSQTGSVRSSLAYCGKLTTAGWSLLYFPEGIRSDDGTLGTFKPGIGLLATGLEIPVVPVHLKGTDSVIAKGGGLPHRGCIEVRFGEPMRFSADTDHNVATLDIRDAVALLSQESLS
jgi:long-chain acyl-CoA synthetase